MIFLSLHVILSNIIMHFCQPPTHCTKMHWLMHHLVFPRGFKLMKKSSQCLMAVTSFFTSCFEQHVILINECYFLCLLHCLTLDVLGSLCCYHLNKFPNLQYIEASGGALDKPYSTKQKLCIQDQFAPSTDTKDKFCLL